jgi:hypothetical protein
LQALDESPGPLSEVAALLERKTADRGKPKLPLGKKTLHEAHKSAALGRILLRTSEPFIAFAFKRIVNVTVQPTKFSVVWQSELKPPIRFRFT